MTHKISEPNPIPIFRVVTGIGIAIIALWFLTACAPAPIQTEVARGEGTSTMSPTDTPYIIVVTATPELQSVVDPTVEPTPECPSDDYFSQMTVGYLPALGLGAKKSPIAITFGCELMTVIGEGWSLSGLLSEDGTKLETCALFADRSVPYPCSLGFANLDNLNVRGFYQNKNGQDFPICLALDNKHHNESCGG